MKTLVCIAFAEALAAPEVAWSLVDAGFQVVAIARKGRHAALRQSAHVQAVEVTSPEVDCSATLAGMERWLATQHRTPDQPGVIFALDDAAVWLFNQLKLEQGWIMVGPRGAAAELALDKEIQVRVAHAAGLKVPLTTVATTPAEVLARSKELPLVLRPSRAVLPGQGRLHKGRNWICATSSELERSVSAWAGAWPLLVQPFIQGSGEGVFGLATDKGVRAWSAHRRLRMMNPHGSGSSACASQPVPAEIKPALDRLIRQTGWRGLFMVELLRDHAGTLWFVELNGRPWGSMALSRRQGLEYPAWAVEYGLNPGARVDIDLAVKDSVVCRNAGRELMHLLFVLHGPKSKAFQEWPSVWRTALQLLSVSRHDSLYNWRHDDLRVFFSDSWYTVRDNLCKSRN